MPKTHVVSKLSRSCSAHGLVAVLAILCAGSLATEALAGNDNGGGKCAADPTAGSNIFSTPDTQSKEVPKFGEDTSNGGRIRKFLGEGKDGLPGFQQIKAIPSLSEGQRKQLRQIYTELKEQAEPLASQLKSMREQAGGNGEKVMADADTRAKFQQLRTQLQALRDQTGQKVKATLTEQQFQEWQAMRKGELQPATFNAPQVGLGGRGGPGPGPGDGFDRGELRRRMQQLQTGGGPSASAAPQANKDGVTADLGEAPMQMKEKGDE